jgi:hypothetical protein
MAMKKANPQMLFFKALLERYRAKYNNIKIHPRGFHYFIVTLPDAERQIPTRTGTRLYENTHNEYKNLCAVLADARVYSFIPFEWIKDKRNDDIIAKPPMQKTTNSYEFEIPEMGSLPVLSCREMDDFNEFVNQTVINNETKPCHFTHQDYHITVVIEKSSFEDEIVEVTNKHGADFIVFTGQASVTRINELCLRASALNKPILALYCSDLDVAGWFMPTNFMRRLNQIYPCGNKNRMERVLLSREQSSKYNLPRSFETSDKKYSKKQTDEFIAATGSSECIELDALPMPTILELVEAKLNEFSNLEKDQKEFDKKRKHFEDVAKELQNKLDLSDFREGYNDLKDQFNEIINRVQTFQEHIQSEIDEIDSATDHLKQQAEEHINKFIENYLEENPDPEDEDEDDDEIENKEETGPEQNIEPETSESNPEPDSNANDVEDDGTEIITMDDFKVKPLKSVDNDDEEEEEEDSDLD